MRSSEARRRPFNPNARGYHAVYRDGEVNHCPGCGRTHWLIGRMSAECAFCVQPGVGNANVLELAAEFPGAQRRLIFACEITLLRRARGCISAQ